MNSNTVYKIKNKYFLQLSSSFAGIGFIIVIKKFLIPLLIPAEVGFSLDGVIHLIIIFSFLIGLIFFLLRVAEGVFFICTPSIKLREYNRKHILSHILIPSQYTALILGIIAILIELAGWLLFPCKLFSETDCSQTSYFFLTSFWIIPVGILFALMAGIKASRFIKELKKL